MPMARLEAQPLQLLDFHIVKSIFLSRKNLVSTKVISRWLLIIDAAQAAFEIQGVLSIRFNKEKSYRSKTGILWKFESFLVVVYLNLPYYCPNKPQKVGFWSKKVAFYYIFSKWWSNREWWPFICTDTYGCVIHFWGRKLYVKQGPPVCINNILVMEEFNNIIQEFDIHVIIIITTKPIMTIWCLEWFLPMFFALFPDDYHCSVPRLNIKLP